MTEKEEKSIQIFKSRLVPESKVLSEEETQKVLEKYNISKKQLPRMLSSDAMAKHLEAKSGDVIEITRDSKTAGLSKFYRLVVGGV